MNRWERIAKLEQAHHLPVGARIKLNLLKHGGNRKLSEEDVRDIKRRLVGASCNERDAELAAEYGVRPETIGSVRLGRTWAHVPWPEES